MPDSLNKILVAGVGPLPPEAPEKLFAPGLRVWGIARELARAGHPVRLVALRAFGETRRLCVYDLVPSSEDVTLPIARILEEPGEALEDLVTSEMISFAPAALVGTSDIMNEALAKAASVSHGLPLWCDYDGDPMAERQMLSWLHGNDDGLGAQWKIMLPALAMADRLSGTTQHQVGALLGQLATKGRMNRHTATTPLVERIPIWVKPVPAGDEKGPFVRGVVAPQDAFLVVQTGGFNTWLDVPNLVKSLELVMEQSPRVHFVCTGGAIPGHNEKTYAEFERLVDASKFRERFHRLGWVPLGRVPQILSECDAALNVDLPCAEGWLGNRNRIMDWILAGLPVVSTIGSEVVEDLATRGFLFGAKQADADSVAKELMRSMADPGASRAKSTAGAEYLRETHSPERCLKPLIEWCANPVRAPDLVAWENKSAHPPILYTILNSLGDALSSVQMLKSDLSRSQARLKALEGSRLVRVAAALRQILHGRK